MVRLRNYDGGAGPTSITMYVPVRAQRRGGTYRDDCAGTIATIVARVHDVGTRAALAPFGAETARQYEPVRCCRRIVVGLSARARHDGRTARPAVRIFRRSTAARDRRPVFARCAPVSVRGRRAVVNPTLYVLRPVTGRHVVDQ